MTARSSRPEPARAALRARLVDLLGAFGRPRIVVVGDVIADEFIYGRIDRVSREAPVLILKYDDAEVRAGGAGNAARNVAAFGAEARLVGFAGGDDHGRRLGRSLPRGVVKTGLLRLPGYRTPTKTRILAGGVHSARQQVVRVDRDGPPVAPEARRALAQAAAEAVAGCDAVVVSDYGTGLITPRFVADLMRRLPRPQRGRKTPVLLDSRYAVLEYRGLTAAVPNESEVEHVLGTPVGDDPQAVEEAGRTLLGRTRMSAVLITRGSRGMALFEPHRPTRHIPVYGPDEVTDVTGAGDTVIAAMAAALSVGASCFEAALLANYAGGLVVMKRGTAVVSAAELRQAVESDLS